MLDEIEEVAELEVVVAPLEPLAVVLEPDVAVADEPFVVVVLAPLLTELDPDVLAAPLVDPADDDDDDLAPDELALDEAAEGDEPALEDAVAVLSDVEGVEPDVAGPPLEDGWFEPEDADGSLEDCETADEESLEADESRDDAVRELGSDDVAPMDDLAPTEEDPRRSLDVSRSELVRRVPLTDISPDAEPLWPVVVLARAPSTPPSPPASLVAAPLQAVSPAPNARLASR